MEPDLKRRTEKRRIAAYATFGAGLIALFVGVLVAMYFASLAGVIVSLVVAAALFLATFMLGGAAWGRFETGQSVPRDALPARDAPTRVRPLREETSFSTPPPPPRVETIERTPGGPGSSEAGSDEVGRGEGRQAP